MAKYTPRLVLRKPEGFDVVNVVIDVDNPMQKIDDNINASIWTSLTRPPAPYNGQIIYESDTSNILVYYNGTWNLFGNNNFPKGKVGQQVFSGNSAVRTNGSFLDLSVTFNCQTGRRYLVEVYNVLQDQAASRPGRDFTASLRWAAGNAVAITDTLIGNAYTHHVVLVQSGCYKFAEFIPNVAGNVTVGLFSTSASVNNWVQGGTVPANEKSYMYVRDWGT